MIQRSKLDKLKGFAEDLDGYEEIDLSLQAVKQGYWNVWTCFAVMQLDRDYIDDGAKKNTKKFVKLWNAELKKGDNFYHPLWKKLGLV